MQKFVKQKTFSCTRIHGKSWLMQLFVWIDVQKVLIDDPGAFFNCIFAMKRRVRTVRAPCFPAAGRRMRKNAILPRGKLRKYFAEPKWDPMWRCKSQLSAETTQQNILMNGNSQFEPFYRTFAAWYCKLTHLLRSH